jgi:hypothetical protein
MGVSGQPRFTPGEIIPSTHCTVDWVGPRAGLDAETRRKILFLRRGSNPGRPVRSQSLFFTILTKLPRLQITVVEY